MKVREYNYNYHGKGEGHLVALEELSDVPFRIKRIYYIYNVQSSAIRGNHAHKNLEQILICVYGKCKVRLDDGREKIVIALDKPNKGLYVPNLTWREVYDFSPGAVLLVLASELYDEEDYIRDYNEFILQTINNTECV